MFRKRSSKIQIASYPLQRFLSNPDVMHFRIDTIKKKLEASKGLDGLDELVSGGKNPMVLVSL
ncbi:hypothetical protein OROHE_004526 [Orobanche hederae]